MTELPPIFFGLDYGRGTPVGITVPDRRRHIHISGATGSGKSTLLLWLLVQDVLHGRGVGLIDPHGALSERFLECIPPWRVRDVCYFHPADRHRPVGFNPLEVRPGEERHLVAAAFVEACRAIWVESWGARLEHVLYRRAYEVTF